MVHPLSIKMAWSGDEVYRLRRRTVRVGDGAYLVLNDGNAYGSVLKSERPVMSFSMFFRAGLAAEVSAARRQSLGAALDQPEPIAAAGSVSTSPSVRPRRRSNGSSQ